MALTDNTFTPEELTGALTANPTLLDGIKSVLTAQKYNVLSEAERAALLNNHETTIVSKKTLEHATAVEKDVLELTGIPKNEGEKYYDYQKRAFKEKFGDTQKLQTELDALKAKGGNTSEADKARIATLEKAVADKDTDWQKRYGAKEKELLDTHANFSIQQALAGMRPSYKADIPKSVSELVEKTIVAELMSKAKFQEADGKSVLTFIDEKGEVILNKSTFKPATAAEILADNAALKDLIDPARKVEGTGTTKDIDPKPGEPGKFTGVPASVKTKVQLTEHLLALGIMDGSAEFNKIMDEHGAKLPLR